MKALTLTQPWATLVAIRAKRIETRSWETLYRGPLAIHAAKGLRSVGGAMGLDETCIGQPFFNALYGAGVMRSSDLPLGAIVATCELVEVYRIHDGVIGFYADDSSMYFDLSIQERAFGDYTPGRFAWLLANVRALPEPIPCKGALGLWDYEGHYE